MKKSFLILLVFYNFFICCSDGNDEAYIDNSVLAELREQQEVIESSAFSFLHISDTHGSSYTLKYFVKLLESSNHQFGLLTGDILMTDAMQRIIDSSSKPIFLLPGNHDVYDWHDRDGQIGFRQTILDQSKWKFQMQFGDEIGNYYYVDITDGEGTYRLICLDQYEINKFGNFGQYFVVMSQKQVDWFISILDEASKFKGIIIAMHSGFGNSRIGYRNLNIKNNFISITGGNPDSYEYYGDSNPCMIPDIVEAYISGKNIMQNYESGKQGVLLQVKTNYSSSHNNFIGYYGGHTHWDCIECLNNYPNQLQFLISSANYLYPSKYDDLYRESQGINAITINSYSIEPETRKITTIRLGARKIINGGIRDRIIFNY